MNGGIEKPFQHTGSTAKLSIVCSGRGGQKKKRRQRKRRGPGGVLHQADTNHLLAGWLGLGISGQVLLLYGPEPRGSEEARGRDKSCACVSQMLWRGEGHIGWSVWRAEASVTQQPPSLPRGTAGSQIYPHICWEHKGPLLRASNIIKKWWEMWIAGVANSAGIHMKQS